jgi:hypothetical protein
MVFAALHITIADTTADTLPHASRLLIGGDRQMQRVVEPGGLRTMIGHSPAEIRLSGSFEV